MDIERRMELYKEMYYYELQHRDSITEHISWSLPIVAALGGGILYLINQAPTSASTPLEILYLVATGFGVMCWIASVAYMARAWWGVEYGYLSLPSKLERWFTAILVHKNEYPTAPDLSETFNQGIIKSLCETTENNRMANLRKSWNHHICKRWLLATTVAIAVGFVSNYFLRAEKLQQGESNGREATPAAPAPVA